MMFGWRSARGRAVLAGVVFVLLLVGMTAVAVWRARDDRQRHDSLEQRAEVVVALEHARAEDLNSLISIIAVTFMEDTTPLIDSYGKGVGMRDEALLQARAGLIALGDTDGLAAIDRLTAETREAREQVEASVAFLATADVSTKVALAGQNFPESWARGQAPLIFLEELVREQQDKFAAEGAAADRAADLSLALLIAFGAVAFVGGTAMVAMLVLSVVRPLSSLRASVRAIASGDREARAKVAGPDEVASLARDFNEMVSERKRAEEALRRAKDFSDGLIALMQDGFSVLDSRGVHLDVNRAFCRMTGFSREELIGVGPPHPYWPPEAYEEIERAFQKTLRGQLRDFELTFTRKNGERFPVIVSPSWMKDEQGKVISYFATVKDITERKQAEEALRETDERYRTLFDRSLDAVYVHDFEGRFLDANDVALHLLGYSRHEIATLSFADLLDDSQLPAALAAVKEIINTGRQAGPTAFRLRRKDGSFVEVETLAAAVHQGGRPVAIQGVARDISERKRMEDALREQARRDPLTGVLNHGAIVEELRHLTSDGSDGASHVVAMVDVNGLKALNDAYGHQVGDTVLVAVARGLSRDGAIVGRYGGDEFVALLPGADRPTAERYRDAVLGTLAGAGLTEPERGASVPVAVSVGLAMYPSEAATIEELIKLADSEMYAAKRQRPVRPAARCPPRRLGSERAAKMVGEIIPLLTSPGDLNEKLGLVAQRLSVGGGYDAVTFALFEPGLRAPVAQTTFARAPDELVEAWEREQRQGERHPLASVMVRTHHPVIMDDPQHDQRLTQTQRRLVRAVGLRSALVAPMIWQDWVVGMLAVASKREAAFGPRDVEFLMAVATQVTAIVRMTTLIDELKSASARVSQGQAETVMLLAAAAEAHDRTTGQHLQNVRAIAEALAREVGCSEEDARELGLAAVLHDIGKIRVPDVILASTGRLTVSEWELLKQHTVWGEEFLKERAGFELAATIARSHHERWDGSGYPDGLSGDDIPGAATIVAVADGFDAMISERPYRAARSVAAAVREIVACSGQQFCPSVVEALVRLHKRRMLSCLRQPVPHEEVAA